MRDDRARRTRTRAHTHTLQHKQTHTHAHTYTVASTHYVHANTPTLTFSATFFIFTRHTCTYMQALFVTQIAACTSAVVWGVCSWLENGKVAITHLGSGALAGLAGITPGSGFVGHIAGVPYGLIVGVRWPGHSCRLFCVGVCVCVYVCVYMCPRCLSEHSFISVQRTPGHWQI